jgi:hypothetical protein
MDEASESPRGRWPNGCFGIDQRIMERAAGERTSMDRPSIEKASGHSGDVAIGFLTAVDSPSHGVFGGYLLVDLSGRPVEFHCTAPVKVSRAQQILYGSTLHGHLHGRQIGAALLAEGTLEPRLVLTDLESMLHVRSHTSLPVALVSRLAGADMAGGDDRRFPVGNACVSAVDDATGSMLREQLAELAAAVELHEPFERIRAAIEEAQRH